MKCSTAAYDCRCGCEIHALLLTARSSPLCNMLSTKSPEGVVNTPIPWRGGNGIAIDHERQVQHRPPKQACLTNACSGLRKDNLQPDCVAEPRLLPWGVSRSILDAKPWLLTDKDTHFLWKCFPSYWVPCTMPTGVQIHKIPASLIKVQIKAVGGQYRSTSS